MQPEEKQRLVDSNNPSRDRFPTLLIVVFIIFDIVCDSMIVSSLTTETSWTYVWLFIGLLLLQIIASPMQAGLSDFYGRRKGLIFSLSATLLSLIILFLHSSQLLPYFIILCLTSLCKGLFGNTTPIVWSAIGDTGGRNERFLFAISEGSYAIGYLLFISINLIMTEAHSVFLFAIIAPLVIILCKKIISKGMAYEENRGICNYARKEPALIFQDTKNKSFRLLCFSFVLWEISLYCILILYADFHSRGVPLVGISMMVGYIVGSIAMKFCGNLSNRAMIKYGYLISVFSLAPYLITSIFAKDTVPFLIGGYFFHAIGNAILCPTLLSLIAEETATSRRGRRFGILESYDTIALLAASIVIIIFKKTHLHIIYMVVLSLLTMVVSWIPYKKFAKKYGELME